jgi:pimeloyl-ACP methyl ester carboxylesterase/DNA-binding CsgD family transcriptional regulator
MEAPSVRYVRTSDGYDIAYTVTGSGPPLVFLPFAFTHVEHNWRHNFYHAPRGPWLHALAREYRVVNYDGRGSGMSGRGLRPDHQSRDRLLDLEAVIEALGLTGVVLFGGGAAGQIAVWYAVAHPERVRAIVLNTTAISEAERSLALFRDLAQENWDYFLLVHLRSGLTAAERETGLRYLREATTREDWLTSIRAWAVSDLSDVLPSLHTPTLVQHPRGSVLLPFEASRRLAASIAGARVALIEGSTQLGEVESGVASIRAFLAELPPPTSEDDRVNGLSRREREVLQLIAAGRSNQQIADELVISLNTVKRHVSNVFDKTGVASRAQAIVYARDHGLA